MQIINHYSMVISFIFVLILTAFFLLRDGAVAKDYYILAALAVVLFAAWQILRPAKNTAETTSQFKSTLGGGQPVLLELQSPF